ncbi:MAG: response regulator, partial [Eubacterium sp.]|nr:response regulator [Eubacterium sp.]
MKIVICDDNLNIISEIKEMLNEYSAIKNVPLEISAFDNGKAVIDSNDNYNIAILDVEMPDMNGIALGEELRKRNKQIVLIYLTAHSQYLDSALNLNAARFFEKPIDKDRFFSGMDNALERIDNTTI